MKSSRVSTERREESRTELLGTPTVRAQGRRGRSSKADRKGAISAKEKNSQVCCSRRQVKEEQ